MKIDAAYIALCCAVVATCASGRPLDLAKNLEQSSYTVRSKHDIRLNERDMIEDPMMVVKRWSPPQSPRSASSSASEHSFASNIASSTRTAGETPEHRFEPTDLASDISWGSWGINDDVPNVQESETESLPREDDHSDDEDDREDEVTSPPQEESNDDNDDNEYHELTTETGTAAQLLAARRARFFKENGYPPPW